MVLPLAGLVGLAIEAAPTVARWIGGDSAANAVDKISGIARAVTGETSDDAAEKALKANPEMFAAFKSNMAALDADLEKAYLADRQSARERDVKLRQAGQMNWRADALALLVVGGVVTIPILLMFVSIPEGPGRDLLMVLAGVLGKALGDIIHFEFGSSRGSKAKTEMMGK